MDLGESALGSPDLFRQPWYGDNKILIGIDLGTTQSGVSFTFLQSGTEPMVHRVTCWPGQEAFMTQSKIPTAVWYDLNMKAVSLGAEALTSVAEDQAEDHHWALAKHFKLHLFPDSTKARYNLCLDSLPLGVSLLQIYTDYLGYLLTHTKAFFRDRIIDGKLIWEQYSPMMEVVITHPNGWGVREQAFLRKATVGGGYSSIDNASRKIHFLSEAEASVYFCFNHTNLWSQIDTGVTFLVCDAGGSTVDIALCTVVSKDPVPRIEEKHNSACIQAGAIFINQALEQHLRQILSTAALPENEIDEYITRGVDDFERSAKRQFWGGGQTCHVRIGGPRFNNSSIGVRRGHLSLPGAVVQSFFDVCVRQILTGVDELMQGSTVSYILLVGGFGDSPYLRQVFRSYYGSQGCQITLVNDSTSKAVADGAVLWKIAESVQKRVVRGSLGIETLVAFDPDDPDHQHRKGLSLTSGSSDSEVIPGRWNSLVKKRAVPDSHTISRIPYTLDFLSPSTELGKFELDVYSYSGDEEPTWMRDEQGKLLPQFHKVASIQADLEGLRGALKSRIALGGVLMWQLDFDVCMRAADRELETQLEWEENGATQRCSCEYIGTTEF